MKKRRLSSPVLFLLVLLSALFLQAVPVLLSHALPDMDSVSILLYSFFLYAVHPLCALTVPFLLTRKGLLPALAVFFPYGLFLLALPFYPDGRGIGAVCLLLGLLSAAAGETWYKQKNGRSRRKRS